MTDTTYLTPEETALLERHGWRPLNRGELAQHGDRGWWIGAQTLAHALTGPEHGWDAYAAGARLPGAGHSYCGMRLALFRRSGVRIYDDGSREAEFMSTTNATPPNTPPAPRPRRGQGGGGRHQGRQNPCSFPCGDEQAANRIIEEALTAEDEHEAAFLVCDGGGWAAVGTDGMRLVVWGVGATEESAWDDADGQTDVPRLHCGAMALELHPINREQARHVLAGTIGWDEILAVG